MFNKRISGSASSSKGARSVGGSGSGSLQNSTIANALLTKSNVAGINVNMAGSPKSPEGHIQFPQIKIQDNARLLPKYTAALGRSKDEFFPAEDLDAVQLELESLLSSVALRYRVLKSEYESLDKDEKKDRRSNKYFDSKQSASFNRRRGTDDKKASKDRIPYKMSKQKNTPVAHSPAQSQHTDDSMDSTTHYSHHHHAKDHPKVSIPKNDTPNKFWLSVEPYCMPITNEDLKLLDDLLEQYNGPLVPPIPELGPHYSTLWAAEDIKDEQDNSSLNPKSKTKQTNDVTNILKKSEKMMCEGVTGPLTQRLVSALIDENLVTTDNLLNADSNSSSENTTTNSTSTTLRSLSMMKNGISLEKRVKKELFEQGLLDPDDYKDQEDEVLGEIKRVVSELSSIAEYNSNELRRLQTSAKAELQRLEVKRKLDAVDQEIIEMYKNIVTANQKRRTLAPDEQQEIYRLISEQKKLTDQLEAMPEPGPKYLE